MAICQETKFGCFNNTCVTKEFCSVYKLKLENLNKLLSNYFYNHTLNEPIDKEWLYCMSVSKEEEIEAYIRLNKRRIEYMKDKLNKELYSKDCVFKKLKEEIKNKTMETKELNIIAPDGYEIDKENSTFEKIQFKKINELPKTWEELKYISGAYISDLSNLITVYPVRTHPCTKGTFPTKELAEAALALAQLLQLRDRYNGDNKGFIYEKENYVIHYFRGSVITTKALYGNTILSFRTPKLRDEFLNNFKDLIEIAKPLL